MMYVLAVLIAAALIGCVAVACYVVLAAMFRESCMCGICSRKRDFPRARTVRP